MEEIIEETRTTRVKNFVNRHKVAISVTATAATCLVLNRIALRQHDEFLREHDLYETFYVPTDNEMGL